MGCVAWTALAWARWAALFGGEAAALDLPGIEALAAHAANNSDGMIRATALWAEAISVAIQPDWMSGDSDRSGALMHGAVQAAPGQLMRKWDLLRLVAVPQGRTDLEAKTLEELLGSSPKTPEDRSAFGLASARD
jgi:hypothetical protein